MDLGQEQLIACLANTVGQDLVRDIAGTCALAGITMNSLSRGKHSAREISAKLFLTEEEAVHLLKECLAQYQPEQGPAGELPASAIGSFRNIQGGHPLAFRPDDLIVI